MKQAEPRRDMEPVLDLECIKVDLVPTDAVGDLRMAIQGEVFLPEDEGYAVARFSWNLTIDHRPSLVVVAASETDVAIALRFANQYRLPVAVQATGHGAPRTLSSGLLLVMSKLNSVEVDPDTATAKVGGGAVWQSVIEKAYPHQLVPISGSAPHVGVVGYTLGGGYGLLSRKHGLAVDSVVAMRIVTPEGQIRDVSATEHSDLYWAILGGGGGFGVVTEMTMRLHPHGSLFGGSVMFDASLADSVYSTYAAWTKTLPDEVSSALVMMTFPPVPMVPESLHGRSMLIIAGTAMAEPAEAEALWAPIRSMPGAEFDSFRQMTYPETATVFNDPVDPLPAQGRGVLLSDCTQETVDKLLVAIGTPALSPNLMIQLRHIGGAIGRKGRHENAIGDRRRANYILYFLGIPMGPVTPQMMEDHAENAFRILAEDVVCRGPLNWLGEGMVKAREIRDNFHEDEYARLVEIKKEIDPENRLCFAGLGLDD